MDEKLRFAPSTFETRLSPGEQREESFTVAGPVLWFGRTKSHAFTAEATLARVEQPIRLYRTRRQVPQVPWWVPVVALALVGLVVALVALWPEETGPTVPHVAEMELADAVQTLADAGYAPVQVAEVSDTLLEGQAIRTEPPVGSPHDPDDSVTLFYSRGECPQERCLPLVPSVLALPVNEARRHLANAGLTVRESDPVPSEELAGRVVETEPGPGEPAGEDLVVLVTASAGPEPAASSGPDLDIPMPQVVGVSRADAVAELEELGLDLEIREQPLWRSASEAGQVVDTDPPVEQPLTAGQDVVLFVVAEPVDLALRAPRATWTDGAGGVLEFVDDPSARDPAAVGYELSTLGDGTRVLVAMPARGGSVSATYVLTQGILEGDHLRGRMWLSEPGIALGLNVGGIRIPVEPGPQDAAGRRPLDVDLADALDGRVPYGRRTELVLTVTSPGATTTPEARWPELTVVTE